MHISVMKDESIRLLDVKKGGLYIDCTFGEGGHSRAILEKGGVVIAVDRDSATSVYAEKLKSEFGDRFYWEHSSFSNLHEIWKKLAYPMKVDGILFDLGFSSNQIEDKERGFSFLYDSKLDMRYDLSEDTVTALELINKASQKQLEDIFFELGEERSSKIIAKVICEARKSNPINSCFELLSVLKRFNSFSDKHFATKIFQALRIYVNNEFFHIEKGVQVALNLIKFYGRVVVITFHSLEDRIIKRMFNNKNILLPSDGEIKNNSRSRSAKLRWFINTQEVVC